MQVPIKRCLSRIARAPAGLVIAGIAVYQAVLSPLKFFFFGAAASCRFHPTCSGYARESLRRHGLVIGMGLAVWRLLKCHPFHPGGFDPVPETLGRRHRRACPETESAPKQQSTRTGHATSAAPSLLKHG